MERAMDAVAEEVLPAWLHGGFTGVAWAVEHLWRGANDEDDDGDDANEEIDAALVEHLARGGTPAYDLIGGLCGLPVYALERGPPPPRPLPPILPHLPPPA